MTEYIDVRIHLEDAAHKRRAEEIASDGIITDKEAIEIFHMKTLQVARDAGIKVKAPARKSPALTSTQRQRLTWLAIVAPSALAALAKILIL